MNRPFLAFLAAAVVAAGTAPVLANAQVAPPAAPPAAAAGTGPQTQTLDSIVALVNGDLISAWDVRNRMLMMLMTYPGQRDKNIVAQAQRESIDALIDEKIMVQEFKKLSKDGKIEDEEVDEQIAYLARQNKMSSEQFVKNFETGGAHIETLREQIRSEIAWNALIRGRYGKTLRVSELRVTEMLDRIKSNLDKPQYRIAEIFLYAPDQASRANAQTRAQQLIDRINQGADFKQVALQFSAAPSASQGGDVGWLSPGDMRPEIEAAVIKAPTPPTVLAPIESDGGIYVVALTGKRDPSQAPPATLDFVQVSATGSDALAKMQLIKSKAKTCGEVDAAVKEVPGSAAVPLNDISLAQISDAYRAALEPLDAGASTEVLNLEGDGKMVFYVCAKRAGGNELPSRDDIRDRLFESELAMIKERYLRDLKREATIERK